MGTECLFDSEGIEKEKNKAVKFLEKFTYTGLPIPKKEYLFGQLDTWPKASCLKIEDLEKEKSIREEKIEDLEKKEKSIREEKNKAEKCIREGRKRGENWIREGRKSNWREKKEEEKNSNNLLNRILLKNNETSTCPEKENSMPIELSVDLCFVGSMSIIGVEQKGSHEIEVPQPQEQLQQLPRPQPHQEKQPQPQEEEKPLRCRPVGGYSRSVLRNLLSLTCKAIIWLLQNMFPTTTSVLSTGRILDYCRKFSVSNKDKVQFGRHKSYCHVEKKDIDNVLGAIEHHHVMNFCDWLMSGTKKNNKIARRQFVIIPKRTWNVKTNEMRTGAYGSSLRNPMTRSGVQVARSHNSTVWSAQSCGLRITDIAEIVRWDITEGWLLCGPFLYRSSTGIAQGSPLSMSIAIGVCSMLGIQSGVQIISNYVFWNRLMMRWVDDILVPIVVWIQKLPSVMLVGVNIVDEKFLVAKKLAAEQVQEVTQIYHGALLKAITETLNALWALM